MKSQPGIKIFKAHPSLWLFFIIGLSWILSASWIIRYPPAFDMGETSHWWPIAMNVAQGRGYVFCETAYFPFCGPTNETTAQREPVPVLLYAGIAMLTNGSLPAATGLEILINSAIVAAVYFMAYELVDSSVAPLAALIWAIYLPALELLSQVSGDLLGTFGIAWGMFLFLRAKRTMKASDWLLAGVLMAIGSLSRSVALIIAGVLAITLLPWRQLIKMGSKRFSVSRLRPFILFASAVSLTISPWVLRNYFAFDQIVIGSTLTGYNMYRENYMLTTNNYLRFINGIEGRQAIDKLIAQRADLRGAENEAQMDRVYKEEALKIIAAEPGRYLLLSAYRFLPLWFDWKVEEAYGYRSGLTGFVDSIQQGALLILALIGLSRLKWRAWPLALSIIVISASYMAVISRLRFIVVVMPLVSVIAATGFSLLWQRIIFYRNSDPRKLI